MTREFVPLTVSGFSKNRNAAALHKKDSAPPRPEPFVPVLIDPSHPPQPPDAPSPAEASAAGGPTTLELERDGERVTAIRVQCSCGRHIELNCVY